MGSAGKTENSKPQCYMYVSSELHDTTALLSENSPRDPLAGRLVGTQNRYGRGDKEKNPCPCWESNLGLLARSQSLS